jgi:hypothetical protein
MYEHDKPCWLLPIKSVLYGKVIEIENQLDKFDSFGQPDVLLIVPASSNGRELAGKRRRGPLV